MIQRIHVCIITMVFSMIAVTAIASPTPVGYWKQISDKTGKLHSIIKIWNAKSQLKGKVVKGFGIDGKPPKKYCTACSGKRHNKKIVGMTILWGMQYNPKAQKWERGRILDPDSGHIYKATMHLTGQGKKLKLHGYIGIPLFGRSQVWTRISKQQVKSYLQ